MSVHSASVIAVTLPYERRHRRLSWELTVAATLGERILMVPPGIPFPAWEDLADVFRVGPQAAMRVQHAVPRLAVRWCRHLGEQLYARAGWGDDDSGHRAV